MRRTTLALACALCAACTSGVISGGTRSSPTPPDGEQNPDTPWELKKFTCNTSQAQTELPLRRLSHHQYVNTVRDLIASTALAASDKTGVRTVVDGDLVRYPEDRLVGVPGEKHGGFYRLDQAVQQSHIDVAYDVANHLGAELVATTARKRALLGACATDTSTTNDTTCLQDFIRSFGKRALRRPVTTEEVTWLTGIAGAQPVDTGAVADVIAVLLSMPQFLYHVEEGDPAAGGPVALDAYALANRLSFHFWQTMPDAELLAAADSGALLTDDGYRAQVQRLFEDARFDAAIGAFFAEWFRLDELKPLNTLVGTPVFDAFAGADVPSMDLNEKMNREITDLTVWLARHAGSVSDVLTSRKNVARTADLARLYQSPAWDGAATPEDLTEPARAGLLTRGAFLASGSGNTRPVMKGFRVRNALLCQAIPPPPANANAMPIELAPDLTTRETVEAITEQANSSCRGCHATILNPLGYLTENFDALGRHRTTQKLFDATGMVRGEKPVLTTATPQVGGVNTPIADASELTALLAKSGEFHTCFARQYFRYSFGRMEDDEKDGCALAELQSAALTNAPLADVLKATALRPEFKRRDFR